MRIGGAWVVAAAAVALAAADQAWAGPVAINDAKQQQQLFTSNSINKDDGTGLNVLTSVDGQLSVDLTVAPWAQPGVAAPPAALFHAGEVARTPPVLRAYPGDTVQVRVRSELPNHVKKGRDEATGLAVHGLRLDTSPAAAPEGSGGILSRLAGPKLAIHTFTLSEDHAPGLHWYRVGGEREGGPGFRGAFYVLPRGPQHTEGSSSRRAGEQEGDPSRLLLLQYDAEAGGYLVNGQEAGGKKPQALGLRAGEAQVLDVAHAGGPHLLEVGVAGAGECSLRLLALDGVPLAAGADAAAAREVTHVGLAALQRARVLLTCQSPGQAALVARPAASAGGAAPGAAQWKQRLLAVAVTKGLGQLLPFNRRLPLLPVRPRAAAAAGAMGGHGGQHSRPWYIRDLTDTAMAPGLAVTCGLALTCPPAASCPAGRHACAPLAAPAPAADGAATTGATAVTSSSLRELTVTLAHPVPPAAAVRLAPARPFQIVGFVPAAAAREQGEEGRDNAYLQLGDWRDVLPPVAGTYRLRYRAPADEHGKAPELQYDGFNGLPDAAQAADTIGSGSSKARRAMVTAAAATASEYSSTLKQRHQSSQQSQERQQPQPGYEPAWALPIPGRTKKGKLSGLDGGANGTAEAYLVVQAVVAEERRNATWVEEALKGYLRPYLRAAEEAAAAATEETRRRLMAATHTAMPFQMPRRYLPAGDRCNDSALLWPVHFTLHLANASAVYPVINKLHALLVRAPAPHPANAAKAATTPADEPQLPHLCSVNVTLLNSGFSAAADGRTAAAPATGAAATTGAAASGADDGQGGIAGKVPPKVVLMLAFAGGACLILLGFFAYRQLAHGAGIGVSSSGGGGGRHRGSRRSSVQHFHDPTTIEQQITELDDSLSSTALGVKASALRHNSRSRNNSMTGLHAHAAVFPPPRLAGPHHTAAAATHGSRSHRLSGSISISGSGGSSVDLSGSSPATGGGGGPGGVTAATAATATTVGSIAHFRSSSSLPTDLDAQESHGRSASLPHNGFGFFLPRRSSFHNSGGGSGSGSNANQGGSSK